MSSPNASASALGRLVDAYFRFLKVAIAILLMLMVALVFGNVALRYGFNSSITVSEEVSRWFFVWMTFLGAIVGMRRRAHLGVDILVQALPVLGRKVCWGLSQAVMLVCCVYIVYGTWLQHEIIEGNASPVAQLSMLWVFGVSYLTGSAIGLICLSNLIRLFAGTVADDELIDVHEEGMVDALEAEREMVAQAAAHPTTTGVKP